MSREVAATVPPLAGAAVESPFNALHVWRQGLLALYVVLVAGTFVAGRRTQTRRPKADAAAS